MAWIDMVKQLWFEFQIGPETWNHYFSWAYSSPPRLFYASQMYVFNPKTSPIQ